MEDSGFDSEDIKLFERDEATLNLKTSFTSDTPTEQFADHEVYTKPTRNTALLHKKSDKRLDHQSKKYQPVSSNMIEQQPRKSLIPINRLHVPSKGVLAIRDGAEQPLVMWQTDSSDDDDDFEFVSGELHPSKQGASNQFRKDGLILEPSPGDDDDLDLIPPHPLQQKCVCCQFSTLTCTIQ